VGRAGDALPSAAALPPLPHAAPRCHSILHAACCAVQAIARGMEVITRIEQRPLGVEEAKGAAEVFLTSTSGPVMPVVVVRGWEEGPAAAALRRLAAPRACLAPLLSTPRAAASPSHPWICTSAHSTGYWCPPAPRALRCACAVGRRDFRPLRWILISAGY
jgi:hypothetical protein